MTVKNRLPTRDRLCRWGLNVPDVCLLCGTNLESKNHLFFNCTFSTQVWMAFFSHQDLSPPLDFDSVISWVWSSHSLPTIRFICKMIFRAVVYFIWKERNSILYNSLSKAPQPLVKEIQLLMHAKLAGLDRSKCLHNRPRATSQRELPHSLIYSWFSHSFSILTLHTSFVLSFLSLFLFLILYSNGTSLGGDE